MKLRVYAVYDNGLYRYRSTEWRELDNGRKIQLYWSCLRFSRSDACGMPVKTVPASKVKFEKVVVYNAFEKAIGKAAKAIAAPIVKACNVLFHNKSKHK